MARHLKVTGGSATSGDLLAVSFLFPTTAFLSLSSPQVYLIYIYTDTTTQQGINSNYGDSATISGVSQSGIAQVCQTFTGNNNGAEPPKNKDNGSGCDGKFCVC